MVGDNKTSFGPFGPLRVTVTRRGRFNRESSWDLVPADYASQERFLDLLALVYSYGVEDTLWNTLTNFDSLILEEHKLQARFSNTGERRTQTED
jgi:hypothetical protein